MSVDGVHSFRTNDNRSDWVLHVAGTVKSLLFTESWILGNAEHAHVVSIMTKSVSRARIMKGEWDRGGGV